MIASNVQRNDEKDASRIRPFRAKARRLGRDNREEHFDPLR
jgi:hypothetical protein